MKILLVIVPDRLSILIKKGEITIRYYNPGNVFDEVHILMTNNDRPNATALQKTVGSAKLYLHNLPFAAKDFISSAGMQPLGLKRWAKPAVELAKKIRPQLIRCHGDGLNSFLAYSIKQSVGIPYIVSLHHNPDEVIVIGGDGLKQQIFRSLMQPARRTALGAADLVVPVYQSTVKYAKRMGAKNIKVIYNVIDNSQLKKKTDYKLHSPVRLTSVGRHFASKNPRSIIRAIAGIPNSELTLIGDGPAQGQLVQTAQQSKVDDRTRFIRSMPNEQVLATLHETDIFVIHIENLGISKTTLEAMLTGLPCIISRRYGEQVPELQGDHVFLVENTPGGYAEAINNLIVDQGLREVLGTKAFDYAQDHWAPEKMEEEYSNQYQHFALGIDK